jgi:hypothetical protein
MGDGLGVGGGVGGAARLSWEGRGEGDGCRCCPLNYLVSASASVTPTHGLPTRSPTQPPIWAALQFPLSTAHNWIFSTLVVF